MNKKKYLEKIRTMECALCDAIGQGQQSPTNAHHIREGQGTAQKADDFLVIALCHDCHQGPNGIHGDRSLLKIANVSELDLLAATIKNFLANY